MILPMRDPCPKCGATDGTIVVRGGQRLFYCVNDHWCYNQPNAEAGEAPRSVRSVGTIKPKARSRVLAAHGHQCIGCGRTPQLHDIVLHVDHLIPLALAERHGMLDDVITSEANLAPMCEECNLGKQDDLDGVSIQLIYRVLKLKRSQTT